ncbi:hypothetical protein CW713_00300 [Methanophagales archaeon]|nr:MAG: hypothetical protein CW714_02715 [Methanophagales archaeon]RJS86413.1 MAG: hypothetical protein CW713_00300 [Methanophagales archaeon]
MVNLQLQKTILEVVGNQIRENNPPETKRTLDRLLKKGYSKGDAMKLLGRSVLGEIYKVLKNKEPFDEKKYIKALRKLS